MDTQSQTTKLYDMGRGKAMTKEVKAQIRALAVQGLSQREIAREVLQSKSAVGQYLKALGVAKVIRKRGRRPKLSARVKRAIIRDARLGKMSAKQLAAKHNVPVTVRRTQQLLQSEPSLCWRSPKTAPHLTPRHKIQRREWCGKMAAKDAAFWDRVIFSDEKRFLLDVLDGNEKYWHDTRTPVRVVQRRRAGGGGVMMWAGISARGVTELIPIKG